MSNQIWLNNEHFPWKKMTLDGINCWTKGSIYYNGKLLTDAQKAELIPSLVLEKEIDNKNIIENILKLNGEFAFIIETKDVIIATVDWIRSIPIFYCVSNGQFIISDDPNLIKKNISLTHSEKYICEFLLSGYVSGKNTLFNELKQLKTGEFLILNKNTEKVIIQQYHKYLYSKPKNKDQIEFVNTLDEVMVNCFQRCVESTINEGMTIVVPLSGGLDSRIILSMLKRLGIDNVVCFSYGTRNNFEANISKKVAETLGYKWYFIEYTHEKWNNCYHSKDMEDYFTYAGNFVSLPHIQDFLAVKELKENRVLPENSVFLPGHSGDLFRGHLLKEIDFNVAAPYNDKLVKAIVKKHYNLLSIDHKNIELFSYLSDCILDVIRPYSIDNSESYINALDYFNISERQAKFIINSVRVYEFYGYQWRLPIFDRELVDFFLEVTVNEKFFEKLLIKWYNNKILSIFPNLESIQCTTEITNNKEIYTDFSKIKRFIKKKESMLMVANYLLEHKRKLMQYNNHPMGWYGIVTKKQYLKYYYNNYHINSILCVQYIGHIIKSKEDLEKIARLFKNKMMFEKYYP